MTSQDAIAHLIEHFNLIRAGADAEGNLEYDFDTPFGFVATELPDDRLQLTVPLPRLAQARVPLLERRLLEANLQGAGTGGGQIGTHPTLGLALIEVIDCQPVETGGLELRFVDFSLYAEYWLSDGSADLLDSPRNEPFGGPGAVRV